MAIFFFGLFCDFQISRSEGMKERRKTGKEGERKRGRRKREKGKKKEGKEGGRDGSLWG